MLFGENRCCVAHRQAQGANVSGTQKETKLGTYGCITILHPHKDFIHKLFTAIDQNILFFIFILTLCTVLIEQSSSLPSSDIGGNEQRVYMTTSSKGNKDLSSRLDSDATTTATCRPVLHRRAPLFSLLACHRHARPLWEIEA